MKTMHMFSDMYGPRLTGSPNHKAAAEWAVKTMTSWGMTNAHLEPFTWRGIGWLPGRATGFITAPVKANLKFEAAPWSPSTNGTVSGEVVSIVAPENPTEAELSAYLTALAPKVRLSSVNSSLFPVREPVKNVMDVIALSDRKPKKPWNAPLAGLAIAKRSCVVASANVNEKPSPAPGPPGVRSQSPPSASVPGLKPSPSRDDVGNTMGRPWALYTPPKTDPPVVVRPEASAPENVSVVAGFPEAVDHGVTGVLVPPRDAPALAEAIAALQASPERRAEMGAQARAAFAARFRLEQTVERTLTLYQSLVSAVSTIRT